MKTKKLLFLTAILMVLTSTVAVAQRGTCTPGATNAYIGINGTWTDDKTEALGATYLVPANATVQIGSDPYVDKSDIDFTIDVFKDNVLQFQINKSNVTSYGTQAWNPTLPASLFTAGSVVKAEMTIIPAVGSAYYGCTTSWKYTFTLETPTGCLSPNPIPYYEYPSGSAAWKNKLTTDYSFSVDMNAGKTITVGINPNDPAATLSWTSTGTNNTFTGTAQQFVFDPMLVNPGDSTTLVGVYTDLCGKSTTYTYILSVPLVCTPVPQTITQANYNAGSGWLDAMTTATPGEINITGGSTINFGPWPTDGSKYTYSWSGTGAVDLSSTTIREPNFNDTHGNSVLLTATITYDDGCNPVATSSYTFKIIVDNQPLAVTKFDQGGFKMYPNPVTNILNVTYNGDLSVSIVNASGQQVLSSRSISKQGSVDVSSLSTGVYFLKADANGESIVRKFVKN
jgi:hypothetical protein